MILVFGLLRLSESGKETFYVQVLIFLMDGWILCRCKMNQESFQNLNCNQGRRRKEHGHKYMFHAFFVSISLIVPVSHFD
jgi:hypothetical protein